ncbi:ABC transporter permease [Alkalihalobacillus sp. AL-G]|uniref:ABC transporter permease subunit n=1 Tax=Alkalihalobacillus sp. AL-G TaxID=2926399 RepID=UPI00272A719F|nr:ABC transporter permease [Alkalihalobacillus sp. AL-G]WLD93621.1 ABC transporter permease [Alkalihalobacillus sp. AL-G]
MQLVRGVVKTCLLYLAALIVIVLVVLAPREVTTVPSKNHPAVIEFQYGFNWSVYKDNLIQYVTGIWENNSLGGTMYPHRTVEEEIVEYLPRSLLIILTSFIISILVGVWKGIFDYLNTASRKRILGKNATSFFLAIPDFFLILCLQWLVIFYFPFIEFFGYDHWYSFILPSILVSIYPLMYIARITSGAIEGEEIQQYVLVAKSKGFTRKIILYNHILKNCWGAVLSHLSSVMLYILSNLLIVEYLLDYKGAAYRLFKAFHYTNVYSIGYVSEYEAEMVIGLAMSFMMIVFVTQLISQVARIYVDPR